MQVNGRIFSPLHWLNEQLKTPKSECRRMLEFALASSPFRKTTKIVRKPDVVNG